MDFVKKIKCNKGFNSNIKQINMCLINSFYVNKSSKDDVCSNFHYLKNLNKISFMLVIQDNNVCISLIDNILNNKNSKILFNIGMDNLLSKINFTDSFNCILQTVINN